MATSPNPNSDVLQPREHKKLTAEEIAKAVARHDREHKGAPKNIPGQNPKAEQHKSGKR